MGTSQNSVRSAFCVPFATFLTLKPGDEIPIQLRHFGPGVRVGKRSAFSAFEHVRAYGAPKSGIVMMGTPYDGGDLFLYFFPEEQS